MSMMRRTIEPSSYAGVGMILIPVIDVLPISPEWKEAAKALVLAVAGGAAVLLSEKGPG